MKRFIDLGHQIYPAGLEPKCFAFYCTVRDCFETFNLDNYWQTAEEFKEAYIASGGNEIERYMSLIPNEFKNTP